MPLKFVLDEHLRGGLFSAIEQHNVRQLGLPLDVVRVGDANTPPRGTPDHALLLWASHEDRILLTLDRSTIPDELQMLLQTGAHSAGVIVLNSRRNRREIVHYLELIAYAMDAGELRDSVHYCP